MALNHTHVIYDNFVLANEIEDQYNSRLDLAQFCTVNNDLVGVAGDIYRVHVYTATDGTEKLEMGEGNSENIEVSFTSKDYTILLAQNRFPYYDEEEMRDPLVVQTGLQHMAVDMFNTANADIYAEFAKATNIVALSGTDYFGAFADAVALLDIPETLEPNNGTFAFVSPANVAAIRKALKDQLQYVESFARQGYIGTVAGTNLYVKKDATEGVICGGTREAVTLFNKRGTEVEQERDANVRLNTIYSRKYYLAALTDATKAFKITIGS